MRTRVINSLLLGALVSAPWFAGCSSAGTQGGSYGTEDTGSVGLQVEISPGIFIDTVSYTITGPAGFSRTGTLDVTNSATVSALIGGLPFGAGYQITLAASTTDGAGTCSGSASFSVSSAATIQVPVHLVCKLQSGTGSILVNGTINACPRIDGVSATPAEVAVNAAIALTGAAVDVDHQPSALTYAWSASSGTLANAASANPTFTCTDVGVATITLSVSDGDPACVSQQQVNVTCSDPITASPIKHVIVLIGENRSFDHVFGTYVPRSGQTVANLLSKGIIKADGTPGPNFALAAQQTAAAQTSFYIAPDSKTPYATLPPPTTGGSPSAQSDTTFPFKTIAEASIETDIETADLALLTTGATGLPARVLDTRVTGAASLPNGPFQLTGPTMPYDAYTGDTTHRFYQMWQQTDCSLANATATNPDGCAMDLFPFVITSFSTANNGMGNSMAFFNVQEGDASFMKMLADTYTMSDNFHQSFQGGTGANHSMIGFGDAVAWTDGMGNPVKPPTSLIANPNPKAGTNDNYTVDGNFSNCSDPAQPGVAPIQSYLASLPSHPSPNCAPNAYYYLNNTNPAYQPNGTLSTSATLVPPTIQRSIGDSLSEKNVAWKFYGGAYNAALAGQAGYCQICNPFQYQTQVMAEAATRTKHLKDTVDMFSDIANNTLPAVSFAHPDGLMDGHPQSSKLDLYEAYVKNILDKLHANPTLEASTLVILTFDEDGGYYDSGFIQPIDFFGDGPRIPIIAVSPFSRGGNIVHDYSDQVSILKFIERNWALPPVSNRSRDNLPNPQSTGDNPYVPVNGPALDDLWGMFDFNQ